MARTAIAPQVVAPNGGGGLTGVAPDTGNGNKFLNDGRTSVIIQNGSGATITVTVTAVACTHGRAVNLVFTIAAGKQGFIRDLEPALFNQSDGTVSIDFSASASVLVSVSSRQ
jgi:hypothetical protein